MIQRTTAEKTETDQAYLGITQIAAATHRNREREPQTLIARSCGSNRFRMALGRRRTTAMIQHRNTKVELTLGALCCLLALVSGPLSAQEGSKKAELDELVTQVEKETGARIGVAVHQPASGWKWSYRGDERFAMASTFKPLLCAGVLAAVDRGEADLDQVLEYKAEQVVDWSPLTKDARRISLGQACAASLSHSDNTAANLAMKALGGPSAVTAFLRGIGDDTTRLDRWETELNEAAPNDPRDTSTPLAMLSSLEKVTLGDALRASAANQLIGWMEHNTVSDALIRSVLPEGWTIADRSGAGGNGTRNITALLRDDKGTALIIVIFMTGARVEPAQRNAAVAKIGKDVLAALL